MPSLISILTYIAICSPVIDGFTIQKRDFKYCDAYIGSESGFGSTEIEDVTFSINKGRKPDKSYNEMTTYSTDSQPKCDSFGASILISHSYTDDIALRLRGDGWGGKTMGGAVVPPKTWCIYKFTTIALFDEKRIWAIDLGKETICDTWLVLEGKIVKKV